MDGWQGNREGHLIYSRCNVLEASIKIWRIVRSESIVLENNEPTGILSLHHNHELSRWGSIRYFYLTSGAVYRGKRDLGGIVCVPEAVGDRSEALIEIVAFEASERDGIICPYGVIKFYCSKRMLLHLTLAHFACLIIFDVREVQVLK